MKNILDIDSRTVCSCSLVSCIDDGTARLFLNIESDLSLNPKLEYGSTKTSLTTSPQLIEIASSNFKGTGTFQFRIVDDVKTGSYFTINKIANIDKTLTLKQTGQYTYEFSIYIEPITVQELEEQVNEVKTEVGNVKTDVGGLKTNFTNFSNEFDGLETNFNKYSKNFDTLSGNFDKVSTNVNTLSTNYTNMSKDVDALEKEVDEIINKIYPVGSIYFSTSSTNPSSYFGGTWTAWGSGRVPVGVNSGDSDFGSAEKTGGSKTHTLSENEIPKHTHGSKSLKGEFWNYAGQDGTYGGNGSGIISMKSKDGAWKYASTTGSASGNDCLEVDATHEHDSVGGGAAHNNLQPYITCYMWKRTK